MVRAAPVPLTAVALVLASCGAGGSAQDHPAGRPGRVDERAGTFRGVGIGDRRRHVVRRFGHPRPFSESEQFEPLGVDPSTSGSPRSSGFPSACAQRARTGRGGGPNPSAIGVRALRYRGTSFTTCLGRVFELSVTARGAATLRHVAIGDPLSRAQRAYPGFRCGIADAGSEFPSSPYCAGRVTAGRYLWFGKDPIGDITVSTQALRP